MNVRLPLSMMKIIKKESEKMGYQNKSEYVREAIRRMIQPTVSEKVLGDLMKRSIEARYESVSHSDVVKKIRLKKR